MKFDRPDIQDFDNECQTFFAHIMGKMFESHGRMRDEAAYYWDEMTYLGIGLLIRMFLWPSDRNPS
jgi:hypothetical protein